MRLPRSSGVLLHPTSLPGPYGSGDLGPAAYQFVDWLGSAGQSLWQMLPFGIGPGNRPYEQLGLRRQHAVDRSRGTAARGWLSHGDWAHHPGFLDGRIDFSSFITIEWKTAPNARFFRFR
jgi:4-alpha-glucanotransferase